ncbi:HDOD domain-containing protein [Aurantivibrio plasticivorans]
MTETADRISQHVIIPPTPEALTVIASETSKEEPDVGAIVDVLKKDVGIYSAILQVVNSPFMGLASSVSSIEQGVMLLGVNKVASVVRSISVRANLQEPQGLPNFWEAATEVGELAAILATQLTGEDPAMAYSLGMFHSCGIPVMMQGLKKYDEVLQSSIRNPAYTLAWLEKARYGFSNHQVSSRLAEKWFMPKCIVDALFCMAYPTESLSGKGKIEIDHLTETYLALVVLAKYISPIDRALWHRPDNISVSLPALHILEVSEDDFGDIRNDAIELLAQ